MGFIPCDLRNLVVSAKLVNEYRITDYWNISVGMCSQTLTDLSISKFSLFLPVLTVLWTVDDLL